MELWRGYFQSVRPAIGRMLINVDISTGVMYRFGSFIDLALDFLGRSGTPNALSSHHGLPDRERLRLQQFISGIKVATPHHAQNPNRLRLVKKLTRDSARDHTFETGDGQTMTVLEYFRDVLNIPLQFPDLMCGGLYNIFFRSSSGVLMFCSSHPVLSFPWNFARFHQVSSFASIFLKARSDPYLSSRRCVLMSVSSVSAMAWECVVASELACLLITCYGQSQYVRQFGMKPLTDKLVDLEARLIKAPTLKYNSESKRPNVVRTTCLSLTRWVDVAQ
jgi:eukaryotic translation initiation factor 2C